jgi:hypothetical protein
VPRREDEREGDRRDGGRDERCRRRHAEAAAGVSREDAGEERHAARDTVEDADHGERPRDRGDGRAGDREAREDGLGRVAAARGQDAVQRHAGRVRAGDADERHARVGVRGAEGVLPRPGAQDEVRELEGDGERDEPGVDRGEARAEGAEVDREVVRHAAAR